MRGSFLIDEAVIKLIYLAMQRSEKDGRNVRDMHPALGSPSCSPSALRLEDLKPHEANQIHRGHDASPVRAIRDCATIGCLNRYRHLVRDKNQRRVCLNQNAMTSLL